MCQDQTSKAVTAGFAEIIMRTISLISAKKATRKSHRDQDGKNCYWTSNKYSKL